MSADAPPSMERAEEADSAAEPGWTAMSAHTLRLLTLINSFNRYRGEFFIQSFDKQLHVGSDMGCRIIEIPGITDNDSFNGFFFEIVL